MDTQIFCVHGEINFILFRGWEICIKVYNLYTFEYFINYINIVSHPLILFKFFQKYFLKIQVLTPCYNRGVNELYVNSYHVLSIFSRV